MAVRWPARFSGKLHSFSRCHFLGWSANGPASERIERMRTVVRIHYRGVRTPANPANFAGQGHFLRGVTAGGVVEDWREARAGLVCCRRFGLCWTKLATTLAATETAAPAAGAAAAIAAAYRESPLSLSCCEKFARHSRTEFSWKALFDMRTKSQLKARNAELANELDKATEARDSGRLDAKSYRGIVDRLSRESDDVRGELQAHEQAARYSWGTEANMGMGGVSEVPGGVNEGRIMAASPMDMTPAQVSALMAAAQARTPYTVEIQPKSFHQGMRMKAAVTESGIGGGFSGQLPPVQSLRAVGIGYEPTRIADLLPGAAMTGPSATWLSHTSNAAEVSTVAEGGTKGDISPSISESQVKPQKIAGLVSLTLESWQDTLQYGEGSFAAWLPQELTRSLINEESNLLLNAGTSGGPTATFVGLLATTGTLTRAMGSDSPLDCLSKSYVDLRTGPAFADPDLIVVNPGTLGALRREKDTQGRYIMDLLAGPLGLTAYGEQPSAGPANEPNKYSVIAQGSPAFSGTLWGAGIATSTQCPAGTAIVMSVRAGGGIFWQRLGLLVGFNMWGDTEWTTNTYSYRAEERVALSVPRPSALNIVTGLPTS